jgi:large subunit ribosomal protein L23
MTQTDIKRPIITEKSLTLAARGWYTFEVVLRANKGSIASSIAKFYKVKVLEVRTTVLQGKTRRVGKRQVHVSAENWKKAYVRLAEGQKIDAFDVQASQGEQAK